MSKCINPCYKIHFVGYFPNFNSAHEIKESCDSIVDTYVNIKLKESDETYELLLVDSRRPQSRPVER